MAIVDISFSNGTTFSNVSVTIIGDGLYRLDEDTYSFLAADTEDELDALPRYGDIVRLMPEEDGTVVFESVYQRASMKRYELMISERMTESPALDAILETVTRMDGHWERQMGGLLLISLPEDCTFDPLSEIETIGDANNEG